MWWRGTDDPQDYTPCQKTIRSDSLTVVIESPPGQSVESTDPVELWSVLTKQGVLPELVDESDWGIKAFCGKYDPAKHAAFARLGDDAHALVWFMPLGSVTATFFK